MDEEIKENKYTKYLRILIDNKLSWFYNIKHVKNKT